MTATSQRLTLESGDRLTRAEFHRRYCTRPDIKKAELVEGVVYVASPLRLVQHGKPHSIFGVWIGTYGLATPGTQFGDNATVMLDEDNEVQPDVFLFWEPPREGTARVNERGYAVGAPDMVGEVTASSASYDLHDKLEAYRRNGVHEALFWRTEDGAFDWFRLHEGVYVRLEPDEHGIIESDRFPGLRLNVTRLLAGDYAGAMASLNTPSA
jgi:Uma2 family endonuclease